MFDNVNVDSCKTMGCRNLGIINSPDYLLQGNNVLCRECGFLFPLISSNALNLFRRAVNHGWKGLIKQCPGCGGYSLKRHGFSRQGEQRMLCRLCNKTFIAAKKAVASPRQTQLAALIQAGTSLQDIRAALAIDSTTLRRELAHLSYQARQEGSRFSFPCDIALSTRAFTVRFNGGDSLLYVLVTVEEGSGHVVALSTNYASQPVDAEYQYRSRYEERLPPGTLSHLVQRKEALTMRRQGALYDIDYGPAALHCHDRGMLVKPVLPAYRHFELVHKLTDERALNVQHYLDQECFIFGGCLMANVNDIHQGRCHIAFVRERGTTPPRLDMPPRLFLSGGIRNNVWRAFSTRDYSLAVCNLTGNKKTRHLRYATLRGATAFIQFIQAHPFLPYLNGMSPGNVTLVLEHLRHAWNSRLPEA